MGQLGMGVMIKAFGGNESTVKAYHAAMGKAVVKFEKAVTLSIPDDWRGIEDGLRMTLDDGSSLTVWDGGQSCCEHRYMTIDDDLDGYIGLKLLSIEQREGPDHPEEEYGEHEEAFVVVTFADGSSFTIANHNEHNGYYGGFSIQLHYAEPDA